MPKWSPGGAFGSTLATQNDPKRTKYQYLAQVFCTPISEGLLARIVDEPGSELDVRNSVWTAPARADRMLAVLRKTCPGTTFFKDFGVVLGAKSSNLAHLAVMMALFFAAGFDVVVGVMEITGNHANPTSSQRAKSI